MFAAIMQNLGGEHSFRVGEFFIEIYGNLVIVRNVYGVRVLDSVISH